MTLTHLEGKIKISEDVDVHENAILTDAQEKKCTLYDKLNRKRKTMHINLIIKADLFAERVSYNKMIQQKGKKNGIRAQNYLINMPSNFITANSMI